MFKYLQITNTLQEMMIMINSLPSCTIVLDVKSRIVEINKPGLEFLSVDSKDDYRLKRMLLINDFDYIRKVQMRLISGHVLQDKIFSINFLNGQTRLVNFSGCMIEGVSRMFLFQFFDLSILPNLNLELATMSYDRCRNCNNIIDVADVKTVNYKISDKCLLKFARKYMNLTHSEIIICALFASDMSIADISKKTNRASSNVYGSINRLMKKFKVESRRDLSNFLKYEFSTVCG